MALYAVKNIFLVSNIEQSHRNEKGHIEGLRDLSCDSSPSKGTVAVYIDLDRFSPYSLLTF